MQWLTKQPHKMNNMYQNMIVMLSTVKHLPGSVTLLTYTTTQNGHNGEKWESDKNHNKTQPLMQVQKAPQP
jgi:hypothetical protein